MLACRAIFGGTRVAGLMTILDPLPNIAQHIMQAKGIRLVLADLGILCSAIVAQHMRPHIVGMRLFADFVM